MTHFVTDYENTKAYDATGGSISAGTFDTESTTFHTKLEEVADHGSSTTNFQEIFEERNSSKNTDRLWKYFMSLSVAFDFGDPDKLTSVSYNEGKKFEGEERLTTNGYDKLATYLAKGLNIRLNEKVSKIDHSGDKVKISHGSMVTEADRVLITVPLGVLKSGNIQFLPPLPITKTNAMEKLQMNCNNKFLLVWPSNFAKFWGEEHYFAHAAADRQYKYVHYFNFNAADPSVKALMTFADVDDCRQSKTKTDAEIKTEITAALRVMFDNNAIPEPDSILRSKWHTNPNFFGSYSYPGVGATMKDYEAMAEQIGTKLFFAGEHTTDYFGTVHGAHLSGLREADKILALKMSCSPKFLIAFITALIQFIF